MADQKGVPVVILIILILISLSLAGTVFYLFNKERAKNIVLQEEIEDIKIRQRITETKLQESQNMISTFELQLGEAKAQIEILTSDLEQEKNTKEQALAQIQQLKIDLEQQKGIRSDLEKKFARTQKDLEKMQAQLRVLESKKSDLEKKVKKLEQQAKDIELGKIVVSPELDIPVGTTSEVSVSQQRQEILPSLAEGKILVVNRDYNFAVINLGSKDGIKTEEIFSIYQDNNYIGDIRVEKVHDSMSAAGFVSPETKDKVKEGDRIVQKIE